MEQNPDEIPEEYFDHGQPAYYGTLIDSAVALRKIGEYREAVKLLQKAIKHDKKYPRAYLIAGMVYEDLDDPEKAEVSFRKALTISPKDNEALKVLGLFLISQEKNQKVLIFFAKV